MTSPNRTIGEALIVSVSLIGFFALVYADRANVGDLMAFGAVLLMGAIFYAVLLLIRAVFMFMTGGESFWWEKYEEPKKKPLWRRR